MAGLLVSVTVLASASSSFGQATKPDEDPRVELRTQLVTTAVSVSDEAGRFVAGLNRRNFTVFEDGEKQEIAFFSTGAEPITIGIVLDLSGSMKESYADAIEALYRFAETCVPGDEYFVITFSDRPELACDFTRDPSAVFHSLSLAKPKGYSPLIDSAMLALEKAQRGAHRRRALLIITDGYENTSSYSFKELADLAAEADVFVYAIGLLQFYGRAPIEDLVDHTGYFSLDRERLGKVALNTGGRLYLAQHRDHLVEACAYIALELRSQYQLGYYSARIQSDGKYRRLRVAVDQPKPGKRWKVRARKGYQSPPALPAPR